MRENVSGDAASNRKIAAHDILICRSDTLLWVNKRGLVFFLVVKRQTLCLHIMFDNVFYVEACEQITLGDVGSNIDLKIMGWFLVCIKVEALGIFVLLSLTIET